MLDDRDGAEVDQSVNHELDWLRDVYRTLDPRFNRVTREALEGALVGLDVAHLSFVRDLNSVILEDQLGLFGGYPESYEQISLYTDYVTVDNFVAQLMDETGADAVTAAPEMSLCARPPRLPAELDGGFTWDRRRHTSEDAFRINGKRRIAHYVSKLWRGLSIRRTLTIL